jgi:mersacidin/lichenicidin family type 2 lantibiotic
MSNLEIVRAWKDPQFRATLGDAMPDHPAGQIELPDPEELESNTTHGVCSIWFCTKRGC